ncbi:C3 and PZP-like alpha-2-macroglobulin domain-containing protein 8, partial [Gryllus bimaculatus]
RQAADGRFPPAPADGVGDSDSDDSALDEDVARTADTLAALLDLGLDSEADAECALRARYFLERHVFRARAPCALALQALALARARSEMAAAALDLLRNASANEEGDFGWPRAPRPARHAPDWLYEAGAGRRRKERAPTTVAEFKASLFTLMTYARLGDLKSAEPVARYLFYRSHLLDRHIELLYPAVQAFSEFASLALDRHRALTVSLATSGMELTDTLELRPDSEPQHLQLPSLPTKVFVYATGAGCATVQGRVSYSTYAPADHTHLLDLWASVEGELVPSRNSLDELEGKLPRLRLSTCVRWKGDDVSSVLRLEVTLFSGFQLESVSPVDLDVYHGSLGDLVWFVLSNVSNTCPHCIRFLVRSPFVVTGLRPAFARVYPAGREDLAAETFFHTSQGSPLLADITDDDLITWFGKDDRGQPRTSSDFSQICECGKSCKPLVSANTFSSSNASKVDHVQRDIDMANILIFSEANVTGNVTQFTVSSAELTLERKIPNNSTNTSDAVIPTIALVSNLSNPEPVLVISSSKPVATESASFDLIIPAEDAEMLGAKAEQLVIIATNVSDSKSNTTTQNSTDDNNQLKTNNTNKSRNVPSMTKSPSPVPPASSSTATETTPLSEAQTTMATPRPPRPQAHSINKERQRPSTPPTLGGPSAEPPTTPRDDKLFVVDKTALWGMLREVVHVELNKRNRREGAPVDAVLH